MIIPTADYLKTVTDLREDTIGLLNAVKKNKNPIIIMHRNSPQAVMLSVEEYNNIMEMISDHMDELTALKLEKETYHPNDYVDEKEVMKKLGINI